MCVNCLHVLSVFIVPAADKLQVYDQSDRLVLLQKVTTMGANRMSNSNGRSSAHQDHTSISATHSDRGNPKVKTGINSPTTNNRGSPIVQNGALEDVVSGSKNGRHIFRDGRDSVQRRAMECLRQRQSPVGKKKKSRVGRRDFNEVGIGPELSKVSLNLS